MRNTSWANKPAGHFARVRRRGTARIVALLALPAAACLVCAVWFMSAHGSGAPSLDLETTAVWKGPYEHSVVDRGLVECGSSTELRCQVRSRGGGTTILAVVPEGSFVQPGEVLVELDPSNLLEEESAHKILVATRESQVAQAENTLLAAEIAKREYLEGLYVAQESALLSALFIAERTRESAEVALESAKALHLDGIFTVLQVEAAYASVEDATNKFDAADTALKTLRDLTRRKETALLNANIASAEANVQAQRKSLKLELERLQYIQEEITNCTIRATAPGQVVYANDTSSYRSSTQSQFVVAPGVKVRERQTIIWLPNPSDMQVRAAVNEAHITTIRQGMPVSIRVAALPDIVLQGEVTVISQFAEPSYSSSANIRRYTTLVKIKDPPTDLRVGMNAEVHIHVERRDNVLQLPVQALAESNGRFFSLVKEDDSYQTREVTIGSTNDQVATVEQGLEDGDEVVINPRSMDEMLELPSAEPAVLAANIDGRPEALPTKNNGSSAVRPQKEGGRIPAKSPEVNAGG